MDGTGRRIGLLKRHVDHSAHSMPWNDMNVTARLFMHGKDGNGNVDLAIRQWSGSGVTVDWQWCNSGVAVI